MDVHAPNGGPARSRSRVRSRQPSRVGRAPQRAARSDVASNRDRPSPATARRARRRAHLRPRHLACCSSDPRRTAALRRARGGPARSWSITELEAKRHHPELGYFARQALRLLDDLRIQHGRLDAPMPVGDDGGTLRVELNHTDPTSLPAGFRLGDNDTRILAVARNLAAEGRDVTLVSKDLPMRVKASAVGLDAEEYRAELAVDSGWTGMAELDVTVEEMDQLYEDGRLELAEARRAALPHRAGAALAARQRAGPGRRRQAGPAGARRPRRVRPARPQRRAADRARPAARPRHRHRLARWPRRHRQVGAGPVRRPRGGAWSAGSTARSSSSARCTRSAARSSGYLPGTEAEKMGPWGQAVFDTLGALVSTEVVEEVLDRGHARGAAADPHPRPVAARRVRRSSTRRSRWSATCCSPCCRGSAQNSRVVLTHDVAQRDNLRVGRHDGVAAVIEALKGHPLFAHVTLTRSERSPIAALVTELLEGLEP